MKPFRARHPTPLAISSGRRFEKLSTHSSFLIIRKTRPHFRMEPRYIARNLFLIFFSESGNTVKSSTDAPGEKKNGSRHLSPNDRKYFRSASPIRFDFRCKTRESPQKRVSDFFFRFSKTFRKRWSYVVSFFSLFFDFRSIFCFFFPYFFPFFLQFRPLLVCFSLFFICELLKLNDYGRHLLCTLLLLLNLRTRHFFLYLL